MVLKYSFLDVKKSSLEASSNPFIIMKNSQITKLCTLCIALFFTFTVIAQEEEKGDLFLVDIEYVTPENYDEYVEWGKEFKKLADETKFKDFYVGSDNQSFFYVW